MLLPLPAFTDSLPSTLTWPMTGGVSAGDDVALDFIPYEHEMLGGLAAGGDATIFSEGVYEVLGGAVLGAAAGIIFETPSTYEEGMLGGLAAGGASVVEFEGTVILGVSVGSETVVVFETPTVYNIDDDFPTPGGFIWGGEALVSENIAHLSAGGVVWGGSAVVQEAIPFTASGGFLWGGAAENSTVFTHEPTGGFVYSGVSPNAAVFVETPSGGFQWAGAAVVSSYSAWHQPTGGVAWGGTALAYAVLADYVATPENPYSLPYYGWALNAESNAVSRYYRFPATSMCQFAGRTFVTNAAGVYEYGAEDDAGANIRASVQFPKTDFQTDMSKRMSDAYFGLKTTGRMRLKLVVNNDDPRYYPIIPSGADVKGTRVDIGKGLKGRYWTARLDNVAGADFELDSATFLPVRSKLRHGA